MAEGTSWGGRPVTGASGPLNPSGRRPAARSSGPGDGLQFGWRPDATDFPAQLSVGPSGGGGSRNPVPRTGEAQYAPLPPFEFNYPVHESSHRTPVKIIPPVFAILVIVGAILSRGSWLPGNGERPAAATPTSTLAAATPTATAGQSLLTQVSGEQTPTPTAEAGALATATAEASAPTATAPAEDGLPGFEPGLVEAAEGDTLIVIAEAIGLNVSTLVWANDIEDPGAPLQAGTLVTVPPTDGVLHIVAEADSLASIAALYGVDPAVITGVAENGIVSDIDIEPGMVLLVPGATLPSRDNVAHYTVRAGDNLWGIADYYGLNPFTLAWANGLREPFVIQEGDVLTIPPADGIFHLVAIGETVEALAARFGVEVGLIRSFAFNQMQDPFAQPKVGQPLMIPSLDALVQAWSGGEPAPSPEAEGSGSPGAESASTEVIDGAGQVTGSFIWPAEGFVSQGFGDGHNGLDIANTFGTPIVAADGGTVIFSGWNDGGLGWAVGIDHGGGLETWYGHLDSQPVVGLGQVVAQGEWLGPMGSTGRSTGPHLHFIVMLDDVFLDPAAWLP